MASSEGKARPLATNSSSTVTVEVRPFATGAVKLGFTRGYVQSQAFVRHFGTTIGIRPDGDELLYDTSAVAGTDRRPFAADVDLQVARPWCAPTA